jgi:hypothetical protein
MAHRIKPLYKLHNPDWWKPERFGTGSAKSCPKLFESLKQDLGIVGNSCIFTLPLTIWLMVLQRLSEKGTLTTAVTELLHGNGRALLEPRKQVREDRISARTGAYSQARQRVPVEAVRRVAERTFEQQAV